MVASWAPLILLARRLYAGCPIDLIPEFLPVIGPLDAWPDDPRLLARLLGPPDR